MYFAMCFSPYMVGKLVCMYIFTQIPARREIWCPLYHVFCYLHYNVKSFNRYQHYWFQGVSAHQFQQLHAALLDMGFGIRSDPSLYVYQRDDIRIIMPVFVDDITLASKSQSALDKAVSDLSKYFKL